MNSKERFNKVGLKSTIQRCAVLEALTSLKDHPKAEDIITYVQNKHSNIATGTIYKTLDTFVEKNLVKLVKTEKGGMRYDFIIDHHHHLYAKDGDRIEDYHDEELNDLIEAYFEKKNIPGFNIEEVKLNIIGHFTNQ